MFELANPKRFMDFTERFVPWSWGLAAVLMGAGLYLALFVAPPDYQQGETVRIMFVHVPAATLSMSVYLFMAIASAFAFVMKHPLADMAAKAAAPVGAGFTLLALVTGSLWGKPMWTTWWVWDARLTSELVLLFLYLGYMAIWEAIDEPVKAARAAGVLAIVGVINLPIIKFSVDWWNTLHQPASLIKFDGPAIHPTILWPLMVMFAAYGALFLALVLVRMRMEVMRRRVRSLQMQQAGGLHG